MAASLLRTGRLGTLRCLKAECWNSLRVSVVSLSSKSGDNKKSKSNKEKAAVNTYFDIEKLVQHKACADVPKKETKAVPVVTATATSKAPASILTAELISTIDPIHAAKTATPVAEATAPATDPTAVKASASAAKSSSPKAFKAPAIEPSAKTTATAVEASAPVAKAPPVETTAETPAPAVEVSAPSAKAPAVEDPAAKPPTIKASAAEAEAPAVDTSALSAKAPPVETTAETAAPAVEASAPSAKAPAVEPATEASAPSGKTPAVQPAAESTAPAVEASAPSAEAPAVKPAAEVEASAPSATAPKASAPAVEASVVETAGSLGIVTELAPEVSVAEAPPAEAISDATAPVFEAIPTEDKSAIETAPVVEEVTKVAAEFVAEAPAVEIEEPIADEAPAEELIDSAPVITDATDVPVEVGEKSEAGLDPIQNLFLDSIRAYTTKSKASGGLVDAGPDYQKALAEEITKLQRLYGGGDLTSFPEFKFPEPKFDDVSSK